jgi:hypothetical protein
MKSFESIQRGRGVYYIFGTIFALLLSTGFILAENSFLKILGILFGIGFLGGVYSFIKNYEWTLEIKNNILSWSYPMWPKSAGCIDLDNADKIIVNNTSGKLIFRFKNGEKKKLRMVASGHEIYSYLKENFPDIILEFWDST